MIINQLLIVEMGREREYTLTLKRRASQDDPCEIIPPESIDRAVVRIGDTVLDTEDSTIAFNDDKTALISKLGMVLDLDCCEIYAGYITVYDALAYEGGLPWSRFLLQAVCWPGPEPK